MDHGTEENNIHYILLFFPSKEAQMRTNSIKSSKYLSNSIPEISRESLLNWNGYQNIRTYLTTCPTMKKKKIPIKSKSRRKAISLFYGPVDSRTIWREYFDY